MNDVDRDPDVDVAEDDDEVPPIEGRRERPWSWHLDRAAAIALIVLLPVHVASYHLSTAPIPLTYETLTLRWEGPWRMLDWFTLVLALVHGGLSVQARTSEATRRPALAQAVGTGVLALAAAVIGVFTYVVFSLDLFGPT